MATGDSQLSNAARLLAAQEFNRRQLEAEARERAAKVEAERQEALAKLTRQKQEQIDNARNIVERQRAEEALREQLAQKSTQDRIALINARAQLETQKALQRTLSTSSGRLELLSGREAVRDTKGRVTGLSARESASSRKAKTRIVREVKRREEERKKVTDLERFLRNERALASGQISRKELDRQIAERKKRGLSKTPQQKALDKRLREQELSGILAKRAEGKKGRFSKARRETEGFSATPESVQAERAKALSRTPDVTNPNFISVRGAGASFQARAKDSSLGQIESQLQLLEQRRTGKSPAQLQNERVALQIASGDFFSGLTTNQLLTITSGQADPSKRRKAQSAKSQRSQGVIRQTNRTLGDEAKALNQASPFAIVAQQDIPDPVTGITDREVQLFREDIIRRNKGKPKDKQERVPDTGEFFSSGRAPRADDPFNSFVFGNFGGEDTTKIKERRQVDLGSSVFSDTQTRADIESSRREARGSIFDSILVGELPRGVTRVDPERRAKRERGLRAQGFNLQGVSVDQFRVSGDRVVAPTRVSTPALRQSQTQQFGSLNLPPAESQRQADLGIPFIPSAFADSSPAPAPRTTTKSKSTSTTKKSTTQQPRPQPTAFALNVFGSELFRVPNFSNAFVGSPAPSSQSSNLLTETPLLPDFSQPLIPESSGVSNRDVLRAGSQQLGFDLENFFR
jgi:hypothetical protein